MTGWKLARVVAVATTCIVLFSGCEQLLVNKINDTRTAAGRPALPTSLYLQEAARAKAAAMCAAGEVTPTPDPTAAYDGETAREVAELVDAEPLDPATTDGVARNIDATNAIWARWQGEPVLTDAKWDELGVGEAPCAADGKLYVAALLRDNPVMPAAGRFVTPLYTEAQIAVTPNVVYGTAVDYRGRTIDLVLDLYVPPTGGPAERPALILVHGGGFTGGGRDNLAPRALEYARLGFVTATIDYRLRPDSATDPYDLLAATDAVDDAMESVRWLRSQAATYAVDTTRIGMIGTSAGGATVLGVAYANDPTPGGPLAAFSPEVAAVVSTGAHLTPGLDQIDFDSTDAPSLMFHYEQDTSKLKATWDYAYRTCTAVRAVDVSCDFVVQPGSGHTIAVGPLAKWWKPEIGPFLWYHLRLDTA